MRNYFDSSICTFSGFGGWSFVVKVPQFIRRVACLQHSGQICFKVVRVSEIWREKCDTLLVLRFHHCYFTLSSNTLSLIYWLTVNILLVLK